MIANPLESVGKQYANAYGYFGDIEPPILGGAYLVTRDYDTPQVIIARERYDGGNRQLLIHNGRAHRAGMVNPPNTKEGDLVTVLEAVEGTDVMFRKDRRATVYKMTDDGPIVKQGALRRFTAKFWVLHADNRDESKIDRHSGARRQMVIDRLSREGMSRIGDTGYATSAREFFDEFKLPHPEVAATAVIDVETEIKSGDLTYEMRDAFQRRGIDSLRVMVLKGRMKVPMPKSECRCKDVTFDEVKAAARNNGQRITGGKLHKVQCLWCTPVSEISQRDEN